MIKEIKYNRILNKFNTISKDMKTDYIDDIMYHYVIYDDMILLLYDITDDNGLSIYIGAFEKKGLSLDKYTVMGLVCDSLELNKLSVTIIHPNDGIEELYYDKAN